MAGEKYESTQLSDDLDMLHELAEIALNNLYIGLNNDECTLDWETFELNKKIVVERDNVIFNYIQILIYVRCLYYFGNDDKEYDVFYWQNLDNLLYFYKSNYPDNELDECKQNEKETKYDYYVRINKSLFIALEKKYINVFNTYTNELKQIIKSLSVLYVSVDIREIKNDFSKFLSTHPYTEIFDNLYSISNELRDLYDVSHDHEMKNKLLKYI